MGRHRPTGHRRTKRIGYKGHAKKMTYATNSTSPLPPLHRTFKLIILIYRTKHGGKEKRRCDTMHNIFHSRVLHANTAHRKQPPLYFPPPTARPLQVSPPTTPHLSGALLLDSPRDDLLPWRSYTNVTRNLPSQFSPSSPLGALIASSLANPAPPAPLAFPVKARRRAPFDDGAIFLWSGQMHGFFLLSTYSYPRLCPLILLPWPTRAPCAQQSLRHNVYRVFFPNPWDIYSYETPNIHP